MANLILNGSCAPKCWWDIVTDFGSMSTDRGSDCTSAEAEAVGHAEANASSPRVPVAH
ncbi:MULTISPECIES: hypothetical protein [unclassified Moorena]|uniref:hypothetical protein n=1 Tax=unclassified Moorena TaxID=2683338 RepID=UPI0013B6EB35|nr:MULTISPECIES: hypothetical protein [unclassified Moorena]NEQ13817.1 hypothetical protein [Moorena sp. SIO3E2]NEP30025.1 hypothetical protein [Moorena sp. SIO3B2]NEQ07533.1 hypothetical protein [Moorena sp. SIO4E2]NER85649.1 hypothetical protein [Moorena sp. SIO3A2]NES40441.1 hypothetical protein [Moorena sp. SIO2C4]